MKSILLNDTLRNQTSFFLGIIIQIIIMALLTKIAWNIDAPVISNTALRVVMRSTGDNKIGAEKNKPEDQGQANSVLPSEIPADRPPAENLKKIEDKIKEQKNSIQPTEKKTVNKQVKEEPKKQLSDLEKLEQLLKNKKSLTPAVTSENNDKHKINIFDDKKTRFFNIEGKEKFDVDVSAIEKKKSGLESVKNGNHAKLSDGDFFAAGNDPAVKSPGRYGRDAESNIKPAIGGGPGPGGILFDSDKRGSGANKSESGKTPGILQNPDLDARDILKKGDHYKIPFEVILDNYGIPKIVKIIKTSGYIKLDNKAINHIKNNWRWAPGYENIALSVELIVVIPK